jgi:hypothetical protein
MKFPIFGNINFRILRSIYNILICAQKVIIVFTKDICTVPDIQTPLGPVEISDKSEYRSCNRSVLVVAFGLMSHNPNVQGARITAIRGLTLPDFSKTRNVAKGDRLVGREVNVAPVVLGNLLSSEDSLSLFGNFLKR